MKTSLHSIITTGTLLLFSFFAASDRADILYVSNFNAKTIDKFTPDGAGSVFADANDGLNGPL